MTGADIISVEKIKISYLSLNVTSRQLIFRSCGPVLKLPNTYYCYNELSEEFQNIFNNLKDAFQFDII